MTFLEKGSTNGTTVFCILYLPLVQFTNASRFSHLVCTDSFGCRDQSALFTFTVADDSMSSIPQLPLWTDVLESSWPTCTCIECWSLICSLFVQHLFMGSSFWSVCATPSNRTRCHFRWSALACSAEITIHLQTPCCFGSRRGNLSAAHATRVFECIETLSGDAVAGWPVGVMHPPSILLHDYVSWANKRMLCEHGPLKFSKCSLFPLLKHYLGI